MGGGGRGVGKVVRPPTFTSKGRGKSPTRKAKPPQAERAPALSQAEKSYLPSGRRARRRDGALPADTAAPCLGWGRSGAQRKRAGRRRPPRTLDGEARPSPRDHFPAGQPPRGGAWPFKGPSQLGLRASPAAEGAAARASGGPRRAASCEGPGGPTRGGGGQVLPEGDRCCRGSPPPHVA